MIKEFAFGLANRHHFGDVHDIEKWAGMAQDTYMSLWDYDNHVIDMLNRKELLHHMMEYYICLMNLFLI